jgi:hypothetical protein
MDTGILEVTALDADNDQVTYKLQRDQSVLRVHYFPPRRTHKLFERIWDYYRFHQEQRSELVPWPSEKLASHYLVPVL